MMKTQLTRRVALLLGMAVAGAVSHVAGLAQPAPITITIDEFGNFIATPGFPFSPGLVLPEPLGLNGTGAPALTYSSAVPFLAGDVVLFEVPSGGNPAGNAPLPEQPVGEFSDVIRFLTPAIFPPNTQLPFPFQIIFYSDNIDGSDSLADIGGLPSTLATFGPVVFLPEVGPEGDNGAVYTPGPNDPGYMPGFAVTYRFISDGAIPEPTTPAIIGGLAILGVGIWRQRRKTDKSAA